MLTFDTFDCSPLFRVVVPNPPEAGGFQQAIVACPASPKGFILVSIYHTGPVDNAADWQHV